MLKKIVSNLLIIFSSVFFVFSTDINLPELSTIIDGSFVEIPSDVIPDFNKIENPEIKQNLVSEVQVEVEKIEEPEIVEEAKIEIVPEDDLNCELKFLVKGAFPGVLGTELSFLHNNDFLPYEISFKQETLFHGNKHTRLLPTVKMYFNPTENLGFDFSAYYIAQCVDSLAKTSHGGRLDFSGDFSNENFLVLGKIGVALGENILVFPFDVAFHYKQSFGIFKINGGLKTNESDMILFAKNNPKKVFSNYDDIMKNINMESFWYGGLGYSKDFAKYFNVDFGIEFLYTALDNNFIIPNYELNTIEFKKGFKLNTALDLTFNYKLFDLSFQWKGFWLDSKYMLMPQELNLFMSCDVTERISICLNIVQMIQLFMGQGGEFALGTKILF